MSATVLVERLRKVRQSGLGRWMACCPAHEDRRPSLSVRECGDGRVLIHCFAGCEPMAILSAVGMSFSDIMPNKIGSEHSYAAIRKRVSASDALSTLGYEAVVVAIIAGDVLENKEVDAETWKRLSTSIMRINAAREVADV